MALQLGSGQRTENFEKYGRKCLYCLEQIVSRNRDVNTFASEDLEGSEEFGRENIREYLSNHKQIVDRNMGIKVLLLKALKGMRNMLLKNGGKGIFIK